MLTHVLLHMVCDIYITHRIHGAVIYGVPWIPSTKTPVMLAFFYQHQPDPSWVFCQRPRVGLGRVIGTAKKK